MPRSRFFCGLRSCLARASPAVFGSTCIRPTAPRSGARPAARSGIRPRPPRRRAGCRRRAWRRLLDVSRYGNVASGDCARSFSSGTLVSSSKLFGRLLIASGMVTPSSPGSSTQLARSRISSASSPGRVGHVLQQPRGRAGRRRAGRSGRKRRTVGAVVRGCGMREPPIRVGTATAMRRRRESAPCRTAGRRSELVIRGYPRLLVSECWSGAPGRRLPFCQLSSLTSNRRVLQIIPLLLQMFQLIKLRFAK